MVVFDKDEQHMELVREILHHCEERGISLNRDEFKFCRTQAHLAGFMLTSERYFVSNDNVDAITNFPTPSSRTDLCSFIGLTNQLMKEPALVLAPLRPLLSKRNDFLWTPAHNVAFQPVMLSNC